MTRSGFPFGVGRALIRRMALAAVCIVTGWAAASAQDADGVALPPRADSPRNLTLLSVTSAIVAPRDMWFASLGLTSKRNGTIDDWDGSLALGAGLGDAEDAIGLQITANITSLKDNFGDSGYFQLNASRLVSRGTTPVYLGAEASGLGTWGQAGSVPVAGKVMVSWFPVIRTAGGQAYPLMFTAGYGSHLKNKGNDPAPYFGAGIGITRNFGASMSWTGETLDIGAAFQIDGLNNFNITTEVNDVTDRLGSRRFTVNFNFFRLGLFRS